MRKYPPRGGGGVGGVLPKSWGGGVPHGSQSPDPISDQNIGFFISLFRPDPENLYPISDLVLTLLPGLASVCTVHHLKRSECPWSKCQN